MLPVFLWGAVGALAPEIIRWFRIARDKAPDEWRRVSYWVATVFYVALGAGLAFLVGKSEPYAAFITGVTTELAILGVLDKDKAAGGEEFTTKDVSAFGSAAISLRRHASYLR